MSVQRYRKRPVVVEAMQWTGDNIHDIWDWCGVAGVYGPTETNPGQLILTTIHGEKAIARVGDWVIAEPVHDRFYPCKPEIFGATYERLVPLMTERKQIELPDGEVIRPPSGMPSAVLEDFLEEWTKAVDRERVDGDSAVINQQQSEISDLKARPEDSRRARDAFRGEVIQLQDQLAAERFDGDLLADLIAQACPNVLSDNAARDTAERALVALAGIRGVTVVRGPDSTPWTPRDLQASSKPNQNLEHPGKDALVDAQIVGDEWLEFAVLVGADTADEEPTCLQTFDDDACAEELAQHIPGAWIGHRRVITEGWKRGC